MKTSLNGRIALAVSEGLVDTAYKDSVGVWTLGIGHTLGAGKPDPKSYIGKHMTTKEIMDLFEKDIVIYEDIVNRHVKVSLEQHEFDALVHFAYNVGEKNFKKSKLLQNLNAGKKATAFQSGFHGWLKPPELKGRRDKERKIAQTGDYGSPVAPLYTADLNGRLRVKGTINLADLMRTVPKPEVPVEKKTNLLQLIIDFFASILRRKS